MQKYDVTCSEILLASFSKQMTECVWDFLKRYSSRISLILAFFFLPVPMQEEVDIIPLTDEPTRHEHTQEMNFRETLDHSLNFDWNLCRIFSKLEEKMYTVDSFIHSTVCLTTGPQPLLKRVMHTVRYSVAYCSFQLSVVSLRSASSCLRLFPLPLVTYPTLYLFFNNVF